MPLRVRRNAAPVAPSMTRWSHDMVSRSRRPGTITPCFDYRLLHDAAHGQDAGLGRIDDGGELVDVEHAEVRHAEGAAGVLLRLQAAFPGAAGHLLHLGGDLAERLPIGVAHHRRDQPVFHCDGDAQVHFVPVADPVVLPPGVAGGMRLQRRGGGLHDDVVERDLWSCLAAPLPRRVERLPRLPRPIHVDFGGEIERRDRSERLREPLGDRLPDLGQGDIPEGAGRRGGRDDTRRQGGLVQVAKHDPSLGARPGDGAEVEPALPGDLAGQGGGLDPPARQRGSGAGRHWRRRGGRGRRRGLRGGSVTAEQVADVLVRRADDADQRSNRRGGAGRHQLLQENPLAAGHQLHDGLVRLHLGDDVADADGVALVLLPLDEASLFHRRRERFHQDF